MGQPLPNPSPIGRGFFKEPKNYCISTPLPIGETSGEGLLVSEKEIRSVNLWEDVWFNSQEICESRILAMVGKSLRVPARLTKAQRIDQEMLGKFLKINHLQGSTKAKFKYGLFLPKQYFRVLKNEDFLDETESLLVAVASFSSARKFVRNGQTYRSFELIRFANLLNHTVVGGLDKLLKNFISEQKPDDIMTYADADWSDGNGYKKLGFEQTEITPPQTFLINKISLERFYENNTETTDNQAFIKISNSGNIKFILNLKEKMLQKILEKYSDFAPIMPNLKYIWLDFTINNNDLKQVDLQNTALFSTYVFDKINQQGGQMGVGGYLENRVIYQKTEHFQQGEEPRSIHLGIDLWAEAGTPIFAPLDGKIHSFADNANLGDYGPTIILEHKIEDYVFFTLYGHLSKTSLNGLFVGKSIEKGEKIAEIGNFPENGNWPPHLHFQVMTTMFDKKGDFFGVCSLSEQEEFAKICLDPNLILRLQH